MHYTRRQTVAAFSSCLFVPLVKATPALASHDEKRVLMQAALVHERKLMKSFSRHCRTPKWQP
jgi:hypothetical protein